MPYARKGNDRRFWEASWDSCWPSVISNESFEFQWSLVIGAWSFFLRPPLFQGREIPLGHFDRLFDIARVFGLALEVLDVERARSGPPELLQHPDILLGHHAFGERARAVLAITEGEILEVRGADVVAHQADLERP